MPTCCSLPFGCPSGLIKNHLFAFQHSRTYSSAEFQAIKVQEPFGIDGDNVNTIAVFEVVHHVTEGQIGLIPH